MTTSPETYRRRPLPLLSGTRHGSRSWETCHFKCGNECDHPVPNQSGNPHIRDLVQRAVSRRRVLQGGAALSLGALVGVGATAPATAVPARPRPTQGVAPLAFEPVEPNVVDEVVVPRGYASEVIIAWGDPVLAGAPPLDAYAQTPEKQARQFGYNNDYVCLMPLPGNGDRALMVVNHEYTDEQLMFPADGGYDDNAIRRIAMMAHGMSVVEVERVGHTGEWQLANRRARRFNRRITPDTPAVVTGPAAADPRLTGEVRGTLNNCAGGTTPWGTVLSGEENFNQYFDAPDGVAEEHEESFSRYGIRTSGYNSRRWSEADDRYNLSENPEEVYKFGWIFELDPYDPRSTPRKRSMLGRFKHEGATISFTADGRIVAYSGDDQADDYLYKFVSRDRFADGPRRRTLEHNLTLLDHGTLYVAVFAGDGGEGDDGELPYDGTGRWVPLTSDTESFVEGFSVAEVLVNTRLAADVVGATRMDRPEDVERNPVTGAVYAALTNNSGRTDPDAANPLTASHIRESLESELTEVSGNRNGYVLELLEDGNDGGATTFTWNLMLVCGDPEAPETYFAGYPKEAVSPISCPDNVTFDDAGNLWISTDGNALGSNDGLFVTPVEGTERGYLRQLLTVPVGAETCGPVVTDDGLTVLVAPQHPGETSGSTFEEPSSRWPHDDTYAFPRPAVVCVWRPDGQPIGA